jgi:hypothetical protein
MCVIPALEAIIMKIAIFAIAGFQDFGIGFVNFDGFITELACMGDAFIEVRATARTSMNIILDEISIANFV